MRTLLHILIPAAVLALVIWIVRPLFTDPPHRDASEESAVAVWCTPFVEIPVFEAAGMYQRRTGSRIRTRAGSAGLLFREFRRSLDGDILVTEDESQWEQARTDDALELATLWELRVEPGAAYASFPRDREYVRVGVILRVDSPRVDEARHVIRYLDGVAGQGRFEAYRLIRTSVPPESVE